MTLEEKLAQLGSAWVFQMLSGNEFSPERAREICQHGLGQVTRLAGASSLTPEEAARVANQIQRALINETRLGIPAIVHEEICSGVMARGSTVYPQAIGVAATFDPELNLRIADAIREQMRLTGVHLGLSPVLDITRDPRWGRTEETYGEDPYLVARMGTAFVQGLQGDDLARGVVATAKHFVGYGASEGGMNWAPARIGDRELREVYLHPFEAAVVEGGVLSLMNGYHEIDGVPCGANGELMTDLLRDSWGFDGIVVSDYFAVDQLSSYHRLVGDKQSAAAVALTAGIDMELPAIDCFAAPLAAALEAGDVDIDTIDRSVHRILKLKFELGLFEQPFVDETRAGSAANTEEHHALAAEVARQSMVLLRNDGILPLGDSPGRIAVIGPNAVESRHLFGDYSYPAHIDSLLAMRGRNVFGIPIPDDVGFAEATVDPPSVLDALKARYGDAVSYAPGCSVAGEDSTGFDQAVALARDSDVVVLVVGDKAGLTVDCTSGEGRDRSSLGLPGVQEDLARAIIATGTPVVTVLIVGRPCGSEYLHEESAAVLVAWLPGQEGAEAITDTIAGDHNPGGKLPITFPRSVGQVPVYYGHKLSGGRSHWHGDYVDGPAAPLYPFGFGLSYTRFELGDPVLEAPAVAEGESVVVSVSVTNVGNITGDEVIQVYVRDSEASVTRPVLELKSFIRVEVEAGQSRLCRFEIPIGQLGFYNRNLEYVVEDGEIEILVGTSASDLVSAGQVQVAVTGKVEKAFDGARRVS